jgi:hypothetical protein
MHGKVKQNSQECPSTLPIQIEGCTLFAENTMLLVVLLEHMLTIPCSNINILIRAASVCQWVKHTACTLSNITQAVPMIEFIL